MGAVAWHVLKRLPRPLVAASAIGWGILAAQDAASPLPALCLSAASVDQALSASLSLALLSASPSILVPAWLIMILAMMPPLLAPPLLHVWRRSLTDRRMRAVMLFASGYALVWLVAGGLLTGGALVVAAAASALGLPPIAIIVLIALAWEATPAKRTCLNRCHARPPLAAFGVRAETDVLRYGVTHGFWCVGTCGALMMLPLAVEGPLHWLVMAAVMLASIAERARLPDPVNPRFRGGPRWT
jgi:predicted metal-binding membrane protein